MLRLILPGIVLLLSVFAGFSQKVSEYKFSVVNKNNGLAGNFIIDITQDHKGFMWFGTDGGLQRFDGKRFLTFKNKPGDLNTIPYNMVENVYEDQKNNLWIITADDRIGIFNTNYFTYQEIAVPNQKKEGLMGIKHLVEDNEGNLYLVIEQQDKPFYRYSAKDGSFIPAAINEAMPTKWLLNDICYDKNTNRFWIGADSGLVVYDPVQRKSSYRGYNVLNDPVIAKLGNERFITTVYIDAQKNFWCVSVADVYLPIVIHRFEAATGKFEQHLPFKDTRTRFRQVNTIFSQQNGRVWICGLPFLMEYKKGQSPVFDTVAVNDNCNPKSLSFNSALAMFEDRDRNLWVGTTSGVIRFAPDANHFTNYLLQKDRYSLPEEKAALTVYERKNGEIWVGCQGAGLYTLSKDFTPIEVKGDPVAKFPGKTCWSIHEHSQTGLIWMGSSRGVIAVYDPKTGKTDSVPQPMFEGRPAHKIAEDKNGNLWFITRAFDSAASLVKWDRKLAADDFKKGYVLVKRLNVTFSSILVDKNNNVWVGTFGDGLQKYNATTNELELRILPEPGDGRSMLYDNSIADIIKYNDSLLVAVGNAISVINIRTNRVIPFTRHDGLPGTMLSVQRDREGILWMGMMEAGIGRFNLQRKIFTVYNKEDGMLDDYFNQATKFTLSDGRMLFFNSRSIVAFRPEEVAKNVSAPPALITDFKLLNISLPVDSLTALSRVHLPYDKNSVTIEFSALSFASQNKINYYYQMEGLDKDWIPADETQKAIYNYLPNGRYTFRIKTDNGNTGQTAITSLAITVHAVFWKTWWFWGLIALVVASMLFLLDRERVKRLVSMQKMRTEIAVNLHKDISSTLNNINLLSEMARIKADKDLDRSKEYIQQISDKSNRMIVAMGDILWSIEPDNDSMERSLLRMREFIDALKSRYNAEIELVADKHPGRISMDMKKRHEFFLIFKDALRSVVELAEGRDTLIHLDATKTKLLLKLQDATANPYNQQAALREAIKDIESRAALINAETDIQYDQKGIAMIIQLPLTA
jgi:ligand-binding sensor domain-containing protein/signal transduction histidine kinase